MACCLISRTLRPVEKALRDVSSPRRPHRSPAAAAPVIRAALRSRSRETENKQSAQTVARRLRGLRPRRLQAGNHRFGPFLINRDPNDSNGDAQLQRATPSALISDHDRLVTVDLSDQPWSCTSSLTLGLFRVEITRTDYAQALAAMQGGRARIKRNFTEGLMTPRRSSTP